MIVVVIMDELLIVKHREGRTNSTAMIVLLLETVFVSLEKHPLILHKIVVVITTMFVKHQEVKMVPTVEIVQYVITFTVKLENQRVVRMIVVIILHVEHHVRQYQNKSSL
jgi:hypothetical protein